MNKAQKTTDATFKSSSTADVVPALRASASFCNASWNLWEFDSCCRDVDFALALLESLDCMSGLGPPTKAASRKHVFVRLFVITTTAEINTKHFRSMPLEFGIAGLPLAGCHCPCAKHSGITKVNYKTEHNDSTELKNPISSGDPLSAMSSSDGSSGRVVVDSARAFLLDIIATTLMPTLSLT